MDSTIFEKIMETCTEKRVVSRCKKLVKKSALTSGATATTLTELAYWLYVYNHKDEALMVCEFSHLDNPAPYKVNYNIWDFILKIWGLEAYILRESGQEIECQSRIAKIDEILHIPSMPSEKTSEEIEERENKRRERIDIDFAINKSNLEYAIESGDKSSANNYRFIALFALIGYGVTGFYPKLEENKNEVEQLISENIDILKLLK